MAFQTDNKIVAEVAQGFAHTANQTAVIMKYDLGLHIAAADAPMASLLGSLQAQVQALMDTARAMEALALSRMETEISA